MAGRAPIDLAGIRFGDTVAVERVWHTQPSGINFSLWRCRCDCGAEHNVRTHDLTSGRVARCKSCGLERKHSHRGAMRGAKAWPEYAVWTSMKQRCGNPRDSGYGNYGARGIYVCNRWMKFENFIADMGRRPGPDFSIDRINNDGPYAPENCRWATAAEQSRNQRPKRPWRAEGYVLGQLSCLA